MRYTSLAMMGCVVFTVMVLGAVLGANAAYETDVGEAPDVTFDGEVFAVGDESDEVDMDCDRGVEHDRFERLQEWNERLSPVSGDDIPCSVVRGGLRGAFYLAAVAGDASASFFHYNRDRISSDTAGHIFSGAPIVMLVMMAWGFIRDVRRYR